jgi:CBS domain-containing protein
MQVRDIMTHPAHTISPTATCAEAAETMAIYNVGALPVCDGDDHVVGIITDRDLVLQCMATHHSPQAVEVRAIMSWDPIVVSPSQSVEEVAHLLGRNGVHRVPVVEGERTIGMLSADDIARFFNDNAVIVEMERRLASSIGAPLPLT